MASSTGGEGAMALAKTTDGQDPAARQPEKPWHEAYPPPQATPSSITPSLLMGLIYKSTGTPEYVLIDVRRNDHEGGTILSSINLPAQSLHPSITVLLDLFAAAGVKYIISYCGASRGRGPRCAGWFADGIKQKGLDGQIQSSVLEGGIKGWIRTGRELITHGHQERGQRFLDDIVGYVPQYWDQFEECRTS